MIFSMFNVGLITPEMVCAHDSMRAGQYYLNQRYKLRNIFSFYIETRILLLLLLLQWHSSIIEFIWTVNSVIERD